LRARRRTARGHVGLVGNLQLGQVVAKLGPLLARRQAVAHEGSVCADGVFMLGFLQNGLADDELLHLGRAFVDAQRADVAVQRFDLAADHHAQAAVHLQRHVDHALGVLGGGHLGHGGGHAALALAALAGVAHPGGAVGQQRAGVDQRRHLAQLGLRELEVGQRLAEHLRCCVVHRLGQRAARHAQGGGGHAGAEDVQRLHGQLEAAVDLAQHLPAAHAAALKVSVASGCGAITGMCAESSSPGVAASTMKALMPRLPPSGSVLANTQ
jgi:hypothetical protein